MYVFSTSLIFRDLDQACMEAVAALLRGLPLQPEESDRGDLMDAKSALFLKYTRIKEKIFQTDFILSLSFQIFHPLYEPSQ